MSDDPKAFHNDDEIDPGAPVEMLAGYEYTPSSGFIGRIRRSLHRRSAVSQLASFSWNAPTLVFREFWGFMAEHFLPRSTGKDHQQ